VAARFNEQHGDVGCARSAMSGGSGPKRVIHNPGRWADGAASSSVCVSV